MDSTAQACRGSSDVLPDTSKVMMSQLLLHTAIVRVSEFYMGMHGFFEIGACNGFEFGTYLFCLVKFHGTNGKESLGKTIGGKMCLKSPGTPLKASSAHMCTRTFETHFRWRQSAV